MKVSDAEARLRLSLEERALLYDLGRAINEIVDLDRLLPEIITRTRSLFGVESSAVMLLDAAANEFYVPYVADVAPEVERRLAAVRFPADRGIAGAVQQQRSGGARRRRDPRPALVRRGGRPDRDDDALAPVRAAARRRGSLGVLSLRNKVSGGFTDDDLRLIAAVADNIGLALDTARQLGDARGTADRLRGEVEVLQHQLARGAAPTRSSATARRCRASSASSRAPPRCQ